MKKVGFAVVGVRNFAASHIRNIKKVEKEGQVKLTGVVVTDQVNNAEIVRKLRQEGIRIFDSYENLLKEGKGFVDIITLPTSIHTHADLAIRGMKHGYNILLEKPPAPTVDEVDKMIEVEKKTGQFCSLGFQFIHSRSLRRLKGKYILKGKLGKIKEIACSGYWPRYRSYYERNDWAGKSIWNGRLVLDGPMHNALAHYLNNMLFLAGKTMDDSAELKQVRAELYRAHTYIEADDTSCLEAETKLGTKIYFYVTHASPETVNPVIEIVGSKGKAYWDYNNEQVKIILENNEVIEFDSEGVDPWLEVIRVTAKVQLGLLDKPYATLQNSRNFVVAINGAYDSARKIRAIPGKYVREFITEDNEYKTVLEDIQEIMDQALAERKLLSDLNIPWACKTEAVNVENYQRFNPFI